MKDRSKKITPSNKKHLRKDIKKSRRKRKIMRNRILLALFLIILAISGFFFIGNKIFQIKKIVIKGNDHVDSGIIQEKLNIQKGEPIFKKRKKYLIEELKKLPYVKSAKINRSIFGQVDITVTERTSLGQIYFDEWYYLLDKDLRILEKTQEFDPEKIKITGLNMSNAGLGQYLFNKDKEKPQKEIFNFLFDSELTNQLQSIEILENGINMVTKSDVKVIFGSYNNGLYKARQLVEVLKKVENMDKKVLMILMEKGDNPIAVTEGSNLSVPESDEPLLKKEDNNKE